MLKLLLSVSCFSLSMLITLAFADETNSLQNRLTKINSFYASFTQIVTNSNSVIIQQSKGQIWVKYPDLFKLHMISPHENIIISDGKTLWFYNPLLEQVIANWLPTTQNNILFLLKTSNHAYDLQQYNINQKGDHFSLVPKVSNSNYSHIEITITANGTIESFAIFEQNGLSNTYQFYNQKKVLIDTTEFKLKLPSGVILDDQRT